MQQWEYVELEVIFGGPITGAKGHIVWFKPDGKHSDKTDEYGKIIAQLGVEGWEVVASSARTDIRFGGKDKINYIFKRPMIQPP